MSSGARSGSWSSPRSESLARFPVPPEPESGVVPILCWFSSGCTISVPVVFWSRLFKGEFAQAQGLPMPLNSPTLIQLPTSGNGRSTPRAINCPAWHHGNGNGLCSRATTLLLSLSVENRNLGVLPISTMSPFLATLTGCHLPMRCVGIRASRSPRREWGLCSIGSYLRQGLPSRPSTPQPNSCR